MHAKNSSELKTDASVEQDLAVGKLKAGDYYNFFKISIRIYAYKKDLSLYCSTSPPLQKTKLVK